MNVNVSRCITYGKEVLIRRRRNSMPASNKVYPYFWEPASSEFGFVNNFGDDLMARVFEFLSGRALEWNKGGTYDRTLYVGGSVIDMARDGDVIWGAGIRDFSNQMHFRRNLRVLSVRGPLTRQFLLMMGVECPAVYGDPGILVGELYPESLVTETNVKRGIVPHYSRYEKTVQQYQSHDDILVIDPRRTAREVVLDIARCNSIASSSLHGIIVAEALGISAFWWRESANEPFYKFYDYYLSTQRPGDPIEDLETGFETLESMSGEPVDFFGQIAGLKESFKKIEHDYGF